MCRKQERGFGRLTNFLMFLCGAGSMMVGVVLYLQSSPGPRAMVGAESPENLGARVPFVGCRADGQGGPVNAPAGESMVLPIAADAARRLAYYKSEQGLGVLAPRGWFCFGVYGSNGYALYVTAEPIVSANLFSTKWGGFAGPAIELAGDSGETSGRFTVARVIARVFPDRRAFVESVINEGLEPASSFPFGPYPEDKLVYRSKEIVEYETPANTDGLGTHSRLKKDASPISGVAILLGPAPDLLLLSVRLSPKLTYLTSPIIQQVERDALQPTDDCWQGTDEPDRRQAFGREFRQ